MESIAKQPNKQWHLLFDEGDPNAARAVADLADALQITPTTAKLLYLRGYHTVEEANRFFRLEEATPHDPFLLRDVRSAVERIGAAVENGERIAIYGDYDVDGVTSVSLLYLYLTSLGADVGYYIPSRSKEGYGLSNGAIDVLREKGVSLMITVDTGITAVDEVAYAKTLGIDTVVTDHHECRPELPNACAVINPHRADDSYPFRDLAGVGVAFKLVCAMESDRCERAGVDPFEGVLRVCEDYADLVAIGTIADVMPVVDENRLLIAKGLSAMEKHCRRGVRALINAANAGRNRSRKLTSSYIGFVIAPRMNAAGRVADASIAVELLLAETDEQANAIAERLCQLNVERQSEENRIVEEANCRISEMPPEDRRRVIVLDDDNWHQGVIGIVSSRLTERYGLPSILITYDGTDGEIGKGSGRSVKGLNLVEALTACRDLLVRYGGHELAAGLSVRRRDVGALRTRLNEYADAYLPNDAMTMQIDADCELSVRDLTMRLAEEIGMLEPFGSGNPAPSFVLRDARVLKITPMGGGKHVRLTVEKDGVSVTAVQFGKTAAELPFEEGDLADFLFQVNINEFNGVYILQMLLQDATIAKTEEDRFAAEKKRYREVEAGQPFSESDRILPSRDDVAVVYQFLRRETANGRTSFPIRRLISVLNRRGESAFTYGKVRLILSILRELNLCDFSETVEDHFLIEFYNQPAKTNLERSAILHKVRLQLRKTPD